MVLLCALNDHRRVDGRCEGEVSEEAVGWLWLWVSRLGVGRIRRHCVAVGKDACDGRKGEESLQCA